MKLLNEKSNEAVRQSVTSELIFLSKYTLNNSKLLFSVRLIAGNPNPSRFLIVYNDKEQFNTVINSTEDVKRFIDQFLIIKQMCLKDK